MLEYNLKRFLALCLLTVSVISCNLFDFGDSSDEMLSENDFVSDERVILGDSFNISTFLPIVSPEIYIGDEKMEVETARHKQQGGTWTVMTVQTPDTMTDGMYSGLGESFCRVTIKCAIEGEDKMFEGTIAEIGLYEKEQEFEEMNIISPEFVNFDGCHAIFSVWDLKETFGDGSPMKVTADGKVEKLTFRDADGNESDNIRLGDIVTLSDDYLYAELIIPVKLDTIYREMQHYMLGSAYQDIVCEHKNVLARMSDGFLLEVAGNSSYDAGDASFGVQWISPDRFYLTEPYDDYKDFPKKIVLYDIIGENVFLDQEYDIPERPDNAKEFRWYANEKNGIITDDVNFYSMDERRWTDLYYETWESVERLPFSSYSSTPAVFEGGDGYLYSVIWSPGIGTALFKLDGKVWRVIQELNHSDPYVFRCGKTIYINDCKNIYMLDETGTVSLKAEDVSEWSMMGHHYFYYPYSSDYFNYHSETGMLITEYLGGASPEVVSINDIRGFPLRVDNIGNKCVILLERDGTTDNYCAVFERGEKIIEVPLPISGTDDIYVNFTYDEANWAPINSWK